MTSINHFPKISVITPVKNSVKTLEKSFQSLIDQNYPNLEFIVIDGVSTDGTLDIIKKYENHISYWRSKPDNSTDAYIEGINLAKADVIGFLNADDFYEPGVLQRAGEEFFKNPELDIVSFRCRTFGKNSAIIEESTVNDMELSKEKVLAVPAAGARFFKKDLFIKSNFPTRLDNLGRPFLSNDLEYMIYFAIAGVKNKTLDQVGYNYLSHNDSLTFSKDINTSIRLCEDKIFIAKKFLNSDLDIPSLWKKTFHKWIKKYRASVVKFQIEQKNWRSVRSNVALGLKENGIFGFSFYLFKTLMRKKVKLSI